MGSEFNPKSYSAFGATSGESQQQGELGEGELSGISRADEQDKAAQTARAGK